MASGEGSDPRHESRFFGSAPVVIRTEDFRGFRIDQTQSAASCAEYSFIGVVVAIARIVCDEAWHLAARVRAPIDERGHAGRTLSAFP